MTEIEFLEAEINDLEEEAKQAQKLVAVCRDSLYYLEEQVAKIGGEESPSFPLDKKRELDSARMALDRAELETNKIRQELESKRVELAKLNEIVELMRELQAIAARQVIIASDLNIALGIAGRINSLGSSFKETSVSYYNSSYVEQIAWKMARSVALSDYETRIEAWKQVVKICYELDNQGGLREARKQLVRIMMERGEKMVQEGKLMFAIHYYLQAYDEAVKNEDVYDQLEVISELIRLYRLYDAIRNPVKVLEYSYRRIEILGRLARFSEAQQGYNEAIEVLILLPDQEARSRWEQKLAEATGIYLLAQPSYSQAASIQ